MIASKVYRNFDLLETYPALDNEENGLDSTRIRSTASILMTSSKDQATSSTKPKRKHFHENGKELSNWLPMDSLASVATRRRAQNKSGLSIDRITRYEILVGQNSLKKIEMEQVTNTSTRFYSVPAPQWSGVLS
ncbi:hypothetical protein HO173_009458 [Letharia columbiana]|uniref:Uncharacterized protein n=1 Tax=Letharia columbiana TaxID=112416 RepID=A0A8H6L1S0_9LECA|nr:uncharacterized protein HO173_009458 [Letharia columbiana]KAF6232353.1 hypothetical protein HO173_009458 [Letharia columbiana]